MTPETDFERGMLEALLPCDSKIFTIRVGDKGTVQLKNTGKPILERSASDAESSLMDWAMKERNDAQKKIDNFEKDGHTDRDKLLKIVGWRDAFEEMIKELD